MKVPKFQLYKAENLTTITAITEDSSQVELAKDTHIILNGSNKQT